MILAAGIRLYITFPLRLVLMRSSFTDAYVIFGVYPEMACLAYTYLKEERQISTGLALALKSSTFLGIFLGRIAFELTRWKYPKMVSTALYISDTS